MSNTFVLVKTPAAFDLPSALPSSLEAELYLYLAKERKAENADADSPQQRTSSIRTSLSPSSPELSPRSNSDLKLTDFKVVENHYWVNAMQVQHEVYSMLPVLHRESDVVPSENVISYLQDRYYDIDQDLSPQVQTEIRLSLASAKKLMTAINFLLIDEREFYIAQTVNPMIRASISHYIRDQINTRAHSNDIYTAKDAYYEISHALTLFAARLSNNLYFAAEPTTLDVSVAASVALCVFGPSDWLRELVYQSFPSLAAHCHRLISISNIPGYHAHLDTNRTIPNLIQSSLRALTAKPRKVKTPSSVPSTPSKLGSSAGSQRGDTDSNDNDDDDDLDDDDDDDDDGASTLQMVPTTDADTAQSRFALQESSVLLRSYAVNAVTLLYSTMEKREVTKSMLTKAQKFAALVVGAVGVYFFMTLASSRTPSEPTQTPPENQDDFLDLRSGFHRLR